MNLLSVLGVGLLLLSLTSCEKNYIDRLEMRLEGLWYFNEVREQQALKNENITENYEGDVLEFFEDNTVTYTYGNGKKLYGIYEYNLVNGQETTVGQVIMSFVDDQTLEQTLYIWDNVTLTKNRFTAREDLPQYDGYYFYKLRKS